MLSPSSKQESEMNIDTQKILGGSGTNLDLARKVLWHERNERVKHAAGRFFYCEERGEAWNSLRGLLPSMEETFFPDVDMHAIVNQGKKRRGGGGGSGGGPRRERVKRGGRFGGVIKGDETHEQLMHIVPLNRESFHRLHPTMHRFTQRLIEFIVRDMHWQPLVSEFAVFDELLRMGTAIDMICRRQSDGRLVLLEFKTGYADYYDCASGMMHGPLKKMNNSPRSQATLQLLCGALLLMIHHKLRSDEFEMYVVRVDETHLEPHKLNNEYLLRKGQKIYNALFENNRRQMTLKS